MKCWYFLLVRFTHEYQLQGFSLPWHWHLGTTRETCDAINENWHQHRCSTFFPPVLPVMGTETACFLEILRILSFTSHDVTSSKDEKSEGEMCRCLICRNKSSPHSCVISNENRDPVELAAVALTLRWFQFDPARATYQSDLVTLYQCHTSSRQKRTLKFVDASWITWHLFSASSGQRLDVHTQTRCHGGTVWICNDIC